MTTPAETLNKLILGFQSTHMVSVAAELSLADHLRDSALSSAELARRLECDVDALHRVLRGMAQVGIVVAGEDGRFTLTAVGACLQSDHPSHLRVWARLIGHEIFQCPWGNLIYGLKSGEAPFDHVFGMPFYDYLSAHPEADQVFSDAMAQITQHEEMRRALVSAYDFTPFRYIVDVGGGTGALLAMLLQQQPEADGVVLDLPAARGAAEQTLTAAGLADRGRFVAGSFFEAVPAGGDLYTLARILHNWNDDRCLRILELCRQAMRAEGRVLVIDDVVPADARPDFDTFMLDVHIFATLGGKERTEAEFRALFARAGFDLTRALPVGGLTMLEGTPTERGHSGLE